MINNTTAPPQPRLATPSDVATIGYPGKPAEKGKAIPKGLNVKNGTRNTCSMSHAHYRPSLSQAKKKAEHEEEQHRFKAVTDHQHAVVITNTSWPLFGHDLRTLGGFTLANFSGHAQGVWVPLGQSVGPYKDCDAQSDGRLRQSEECILYSLQARIPWIIFWRVLQDQGTTKFKFTFIENPPKFGNYLPAFRRTSGSFLATSMLTDGPRSLSPLDHQTLRLASCACVPSSPLARRALAVKKYAEKNRLCLQAKAREVMERLWATPGCKTRLKQQRFGHDKGYRERCVIYLPTETEVWVFHLDTLLILTQFLYRKYITEYGKISFAHIYHPFLTFYKLGGLEGKQIREDRAASEHQCLLTPGLDAQDTEQQGSATEVGGEDSEEEEEEAAPKKKEGPWKAPGARTKPHPMKKRKSVEVEVEGTSAAENLKAPETKANWEAPREA
ncbi:hypothetical protein B0H11DRAFT_1928699 [Mycena galericulata]|nr:hypothetical protein B0H11DRAFT_1928699 [Mycena galericulata]